ncbi:MAG: PDZ domain-containing protein, partial [Methylobacter sp.]
TIVVKVGLLPETDEKLTEPKVESKPTNRLGINVIDLTNGQRESLQVIKNGVLVQDVGEGPAKEAGIQRGDVILRIQNNIIRNVTDFEKIIKSLPVGKSVAVLIQRQGNPVFLAFKIDK